MARHASAARTAPIHPRRVSGPVRRPVPVGAPVRGRTGAFERLARIPDHRVIDRLLRGRACIWVIGIMLGGIVFMQVSLLRMNTGISRAVAAQVTYERQNTGLQAQIAELTSGDRIRAAALDHNLVDPRAGTTRFLTARESDVPRALRRMRSPSQRARDIMANGGVEQAPITEIAGPGGAVVAAVAQQAPIAPVATPTPLPTPGVTPQPTVTAPPAATPIPGATVVPQG